METNKERTNRDRTNRELSGWGGVGWGGVGWGGVGWGAGVIGKTPVVFPFQALYINPDAPTYHVRS